MMRFLLIFLASFCALLTGCGKNDADEKNLKIMTLSLGRKISTLDPALAADTTSQYIAGAFYDTLYQYDYDARPYKLIPSAAESMPEISENNTVFKIKLRKDLLFSRDCEGNNRKLTSEDVAFSILRLADARLKSSGFWLIRGKIKGIDDFWRKTASLPLNDMTIYEKGCEGIETPDEHTIIIKLIKPDPRLIYALAMPYTGIVSKKDAVGLANNLAENVRGSGPFTLGEWIRDYKICFEKNEKYRTEYYSNAVLEPERKMPLPYLDRVVCYLVRQPLAEWLMFLKGELDMSSLDNENFDAVTDENMQLIPALSARKIKMYQIPEMQINYIAFSFTDTVLASNLKLRQAMSCAFNYPERMKHSNGRLVPANGPLPSTVEGYDSTYTSPYGHYDLEKAKRLMAEAGFPGGINPATGESLEFVFDLPGSDSSYRQLAEMMVNDMKALGIKIRPELNNKPRFMQKLSKGQSQLFRFSWTGDYPDAENFLQVFYGPNAGSCNRAFYKDAKYDRIYDSIKEMPNTPERTLIYKEMSRYLCNECPWIFESCPVSYILAHSWINNYRPHDFAFGRWKYISINNEDKNKTKKTFLPLEMNDLRK